MSEVNTTCPYYTTKAYPCANPQLYVGKADWCNMKNNWLITEYNDGTHESDCDRCQFKFTVKSPNYEVLYEDDHAILEKDKDTGKYRISFFDDYHFKGDVIFENGELIIN